MSLKITVHHVFENEPQQQGLLHQLLQQVGILNQNVRTLMAQSKEMSDFIARLNTVTNTLAERVKALKDKITQGGMSAEEEKAGIAEADAIVSSLEKIGADNTDPVPEPEPTPNP